MLIFTLVKSFVGIDSGNIASDLQLAREYCRDLFTTYSRLRDYAARTARLEINS